MMTRSRSVPPFRGFSSDAISESSSNAYSPCIAGIGIGSNLKVIGRRCVLATRPGRADIRRVAVWDTGLRYLSSSASRSASGHSLFRAQRLSCGLSEHEVFDLLCRDITPEDYDMLLKLDEMLPRKIVRSEALRKLQPVSSWRYDSCGICLMPFDSGGDVVSVPCTAAHEFHSTCIEKWLTQYKNTCPIDHAELWPTEDQLLR